MASFKDWVRALRAPFFSASIWPVVIGTSAAYYATSETDWLRAGLALLAIVLINLGTNLTNDYYDHKSGNDEANLQYNPFSGGSRVIQEGIISPKAVLAAALTSFGLAGALGIYLNYLAGGWVILAIGLFGVLAGFFYTATPVKLGYRHMGEILVGICLGPLAVIGAYYLQTGEVAWQVAVFAGIPIGLLVYLILYINEFPDYEADKAAGKLTIVVLLGCKKARFGFHALISSVFIVVIVGSISGYLPPWSLLALGALPLALKAMAVIHKNYDRFPQMLAASAMTIMTHLAVGLLLSLGYVLGRLV